MRTRAHVSDVRLVEEVMRVGIISDTHGLLRPEAKRRLAGAMHIIHAGDIGREDILVELG